MAPKRPAPLSDAAIGASQLTDVAVAEGSGAAAAAAPGAAVNGAQNYTVKNTFIDVPSGLTPSNMKVDMRQQLLTAPAELHMQPGFVQRAIASTATPSGASVQYLAAAVPSSPSSTAVASGGRPLERRVVLQPSTPLSVPFEALATPSPTTAAQRVYSIHGAFAAATAGGAGNVTSVVHGGQPMPPSVSYALSPSSARTTLQAPGQPLMYSAQPMQYSRSLVQHSSIPWEEVEDDEDSDEDAEAQGQQMRDPTRRPEDAPKPPPGALHPSLGSEGHTMGTCKRCCFFPRNRCTNGYECEFCHYEHEKRKRKNKKKKKKDGAVQAVTSMASVQGGQRVIVVQGQVQHLVGSTMPAAVASQSPAVYQLAPAVATVPQGATAAEQAAGVVAGLPPAPTYQAPDGRLSPHQLSPQPQPAQPLQTVVMPAGYAQQPPQYMVPQLDGQAQQPPMVFSSPPQAPLAFGAPQGGVAQPLGQQPVAPQPVAQPLTYYVQPGQPVPMTQQPHQMVQLQAAPSVQQGMPPLLHPPTSPPPAHLPVQQGGALAQPPSPPPVGVPLQQAADAGPPPPPMSPTFRQVVTVTGGPAVPPPMVSPKLPRDMVRTMFHPTVTATVPTSATGPAPVMSVQ